VSVHGKSTHLFFEHFELDFRLREVAVEVQAAFPDGDALGRARYLLQRRVGALFPSLCLVRVDACPSTTRESQKRNKKTTKNSE
jgi:hypothetical protein